MDQVVLITKDTTMNKIEETLKAIMIHCDWMLLMAKASELRRT